MSGNAVRKGCSYENCDRSTRSASGDLCHAHSEQLRRRGYLAPLQNLETIYDRFWRYTIKDGPTVTGSDPLVSEAVLGTKCWTWTGPRTTVGPYARFRHGGKSHRAHRISLLAAGKPLGQEEPVDHLCRNTLCVNPEHLEPVTPRENSLRGAGPPGENSRQKFCKNGHDLDDPANHYPSGKRGRSCLTCSREYNRVASFAKNTHCKRGHLRTEENTQISTSGRRMCVDCLTKDRFCRLGHEISGDNVAGGKYTICRRCRDEYNRSRKSTK